MEEEFADWYDNQHLADVLDIPGFASARRFVRSQTQREEDALTYPYNSLAIYEFDSEPRRALDGLTRAKENGLYLSPSLAEQRISIVFDPVSELGI
ncbi:hypothetical protein [Agrococcus baldri]|nr:hypothetical protein [Agrococcus baldri]